MKKSLVILAAGMGSRYGGMKQLEGVGPSGEIIMDYSVYDAARAGFSKVVFVIRPEMSDDFAKFASRRYRGVIETDFSVQHPVPGADPERKKPWGTAHAVLSAAEHVDEPFALINADDFYGRESYTRISRFLDGKDNDSRKYGLVAYTLKNTLSEHGTVSRGICAAATGGRLVRIEEFTGISECGGKIRGSSPGGERIFDGREPVSMNFWGFTPAVFKDIELEFQIFLRENSGSLSAECYLPSVVTALMEKGKAELSLLESASRWFGMTYPGDRGTVEESIRSLIDLGEYPRNLYPE